MPRLASITSQALTGAGRSFSATYSVTPAADNVDEGSTLTINVATTNVPNGTTLYYTLSSSLDFLPNANGSFSINSNSGSFDITPNEDNSTEGPDNTQVMIRTGSIDGPIVVTSSIITINDTSTTPVSWDRQETMSNPNIDTGSSSDRFGFGNAITDTYIIIAADLEDAGVLSNQGVVYVYEIVNESTITLRHTLTNPNGGPNQFWGQRLDAQGDYLVVGDSTSNKVQVYQFSNMSGSTISIADYTITESTASSSFADTVAIDRGWIVVGDPGVNSSNGCAYVYNTATFSGSNITSPAHVLENPYTNTGTADRMGQTVDIDKDQIVISMTGYNETANSLGRIMLYDKSNFTTTNVSSPDHFYDNPNDQANFGGANPHRVAINQDAGLVAICHQFYDAGAGILQGRVYVIDTSGNLERILESPDAGADDRFGTTCVFTPNGDQLIVTMQNSSQATYVYNTSTILAQANPPLTSADYKRISGNFSPNTVSANDTRFVVGSQTSTILPQVFYKFQ